MLTSNARICIGACLLIVGVNAYAASVTFTDTSLGGGNYLFSYTVTSAPVASKENPPSDDPAMQSCIK
jgi:hypothetical protein